MPNLPNKSAQQAKLSWLQSSNGEWLYFIDESIASKDNLPVVEQDYIWLVSQATAPDQVRGYRITHDTIERLIEQLTGVNQAIAFGVPHEQKGNGIHVYVELTNSGVELSTLSRAINAKLAGCLGEFSRADVIKYVDQFPAVQNKDVSRKILKSQYITVNCAA